MSYLDPSDRHERPITLSEAFESPHADGPSLRLAAPGQILVQFNRAGDEAASRVDVAIKLNGTHWAVLPAAQNPAGSDMWEVTCTVPPQATPGRLAVQCWDMAADREILCRDIELTDMVVNAQGLAARDVYEPSAHALFSAPWMEFDGATLTVSGAHLPPAGDPALLSVEFEEGVVGSFEYPLPSPDFGTHYWYWPNAHMSGFRVHIDLPACKAGSNPFTFRFVSGGKIAASGKASPFALNRSKNWADRGRVWIPSDLHAYLQHPANVDQMSRVQTWSNQQTVTFTGYSAFKGVESLAARYGVTRRPGLQVLDWGCGHGRLTRHFIAEWSDAVITGADIDAENIAWCREHLPGGHFQVAPLWPQLDVPSKTFDLVFGLSVMTHLTADAQEAWILELNRVLKPGGLALITFGGDGAAAYASRHHSEAWWHNWISTGFDDALPDPALVGKIADPDYYRVTHQTAEYTVATWSRFMTVVGVVSQAFGYQDVAILRAR